MKVDVRVLLVQMVSMFLVFALALFVPTGTFRWRAGWVFLGVFFGFVVALSLWLLRHNPGLLQERMTGGGNPDQEPWDVQIQILNGFLFLIWLVLMPLDAVRFQWSWMPGWLHVVGAVILLCSIYLFFLTFRENSFLSPVVRIQEERGQTVVSTGPYHYVRHPMYSAFFLFLLGTGLLLGSWYGLLFGLTFVVTITVRAVLEERTLREKLPGYDAYMSQVKYRFIPHVW